MTIILQSYESKRKRLKKFAFNERKRNVLNAVLVPLKLPKNACAVLWAAVAGVVVIGMMLQNPRLPLPPNRIILQVVIVVTGDTGTIPKMTTDIRVATETMIGLDTVTLAVLRILRIKGGILTTMTTVAEFVNEITITPAVPRLSVPLHRQNLSQEERTNVNPATDLHPRIHRSMKPESLSNPFQPYKTTPH